MSGAHLAALGGTAAAALILGVAARRGEGWTGFAIKLLAVVLIANETAYFIGIGIEGAATGTWSVTQGLPLNLCDLMPFIAGAALLRPRALLCDLTYFWALAGTLQGLLTPDVARVFGSYDWWQYYIAHGGVVVAGIAIVARGHVPREGAVWRMLGATLLLAAFVGTVDALTGANYMNLAAKTPPGTTPMDLLSPWPWYIPECVVLAAAIYALLDLPFRHRRATVVKPALTVRSA